MSRSIVGLLLVLLIASPDFANEQPVDETTTDVKQVSEGQDGILKKVETEVVRLTNKFRARFGRPPLKIDVRLVETAKRHCKWMTKARRMVHSRLFAPVCAENIAMGQRSAEQVVNAWINSKGHRANMLRSSHQTIGVAAYQTPGGTIYWCQQFGR